MFILPPPPPPPPTKHFVLKFSCSLLKFSDVSKSQVFQCSLMAPKTSFFPIVSGNFPDGLEQNIFFLEISVFQITARNVNINETSVVFRMSVPYIYRSLFFKKNGFFYHLLIFFVFLFLFLSVCDVYKYC